MEYLLQVNALPNLMFFLGGTGLGPSCTISKNGGGFSGTSNSPTEVGNGWYAIQMAPGETDSAGSLAFHFSAGTPADFLVQVGAIVGADVEQWRGEVPLALQSNQVQAYVADMANAVMTAAKFHGNVVPFFFSTQNLGESYAADGSAATLAQLLYMIWSALSEFAITGGTLSCKKLDGSTEAMSFALSPAGNPTSRARTT